MPMYLIMPKHIPRPGACLGGLVLSRIEAERRRLCVLSTSVLLNIVNWIDTSLPSTLLTLFAFDTLLTPLITIPLSGERCLFRSAH